MDAPEQCSQRYDRVGDMRPSETGEYVQYRHYADARAEIAKLRQWVNDLQSGMYVNCVYCGYRYCPSSQTPTTMADVLKAHIEKCPEHPMSHLKAERDAARAELAELKKDRDTFRSLYQQSQS